MVQRNVHRRQLASDGSIRSSRFLRDDEIVRLLMRFLQRSAIFGLGIFSVWLIVFVVLETADRRLPWILALGITYGFAAYVFLPWAIRLGLKILQRKRVPRRAIP